MVVFYALYLTGSRSSLIGALLIIFFHINQTKKQGLKLIIMGGVLLVIPDNLFRNIDLLFTKIKSDETIELAFSNDDFTQCNRYEVNNSNAIYDWELAFKKII